MRVSCPPVRTRPPATAAATSNRRMTGLSVGAAVAREHGDAADPLQIRPEVGRGPAAGARRGVGDRVGLSDPDFHDEPAPWAYHPGSFGDEAPDDVQAVPAGVKRRGRLVPGD